MRYHDERLRWLQENFSYIDSVTMIDATGKITVKERYNPRYSDAENAADNEWCLNRNLLEVFPSLSHSDSTLLQALQKGELLYRENQCTINHSGKKSVTSNVTFPIISRGKIIGAVELSRDVTHYEGERTAPAARPTPKRRSGTEAKWTLEDIVTQNSKMLEIKREDVVFALDAIVDPVSLYEPVYSDGGDTICVMDQVKDSKNTDESWLEQIALKEAIARLSERERHILNLRFFEGKTQMEVSAEVGISQAQVSRLEKNAISQIKKNL